MRLKGLTTMGLEKKNPFNKLKLKKIYNIAKKITPGYIENSIHDTIPSIDDLGPYFIKNIFFTSEKQAVEKSICAMPYSFKTNEIISTNEQLRSSLDQIFKKIVYCEVKYRYYIRHRKSTNLPYYDEDERNAKRIEVRKNRRKLTFISNRHTTGYLYPCITIDDIIIPLDNAFDENGIWINDPDKNIIMKMIMICYGIRRKEGIIEIFKQLI